MNCNHFTRLTGSKRNLLALLASSAVFYGRLREYGDNGNPFEPA